MLISAIFKIRCFFIKTSQKKKMHLFKAHGKLPKIACCPKKANSQKATIFSHLDFNYRFWNRTKSCLPKRHARGLYRRSGFSPCPEDCFVSI
jgi:hypothetical protein